MFYMKAHVTLPRRAQVDARLNQVHFATGAPVVAHRWLTKAEVITVLSGDSNGKVHVTAVSRALID